METPKTQQYNTINQESEKRQIPEGLYYQSPDGLVGIAIKIQSAKRAPQHDYPIAVLRLTPKNGSRVQRLEGIAGGIEYLASYDDIRKWLEIIALADPHFTFNLGKTVKSKSESRKEYWRQRNAQCFGFGK